MLENMIKLAAKELGRRGGLVGGKSKSKAKTEASRSNGKLGGRPGKPKPTNE